MTNETTIGTRALTRLIIVLIALWSLAAGLALVAFQGTSSGALGAGLTDPAAQRLVGAHMLVLVPVYLLLAWRFDRYQGLLWLPLVAQLAVALSVGYSLVEGDSKFEEAILALAVSVLLASLYGFVWISEQRTVAREKIERAESDAQASLAEED